ncbi:MAG TPA: hypothetical protein VMG10_33025 [Gemmataceae bacterium]|nr:hypothetical protein [Gemmataceae bacterium]
MGMIHVHWGSHTGGARNCRADEYDTCEYFILIIGIPLYLSFQGCFHVIERPREQRERLCEFAQTFLDLPGLLRRTVLPLRPLSTLKRMWFYYYFLWMLGIGTASGAILLLLLTLFPMPMPNVDNLVSIIVWSIAIAFVAALIPYLFLRRPSRRQARIRSIVASGLGFFSDPADWAEQMVTRVIPAFGIAAPTSEELMRKAEELLKAKHYEDSLVVARMALALLASPFDHPLGKRAEDITEDCLRAATEEDK